MADNTPCACGRRVSSELLAEGSLADPRLTDDKAHAATALSCLLEGGIQLSKLSIPTEKHRRRSCWVVMSHGAAIMIGAWLHVNSGSSAPWPPGAVVRYWRPR
jgi:hypothetical protein